MPRFASSVRSSFVGDTRFDECCDGSRYHFISGGMPGNDLFPLDSLDEIFVCSQKKENIALQYGPTNGLPSMLESLAAYLEKKGLRLRKIEDDDHRFVVQFIFCQGIHRSGDTVLVEKLSSLVPCRLSVPMKPIW